MNDKTQERAADCKCTKVPPICPQYKNGVCIAFSYCQYKRPFTNADRIRAMSDEKLADNRVGEILGIAPCPLWVAVDAPEKQYLSKKKAIEVELAWLQQPAPEEEEQNA